jgi:hypothetical protein
MRCPVCATEFDPEPAGRYDTHQEHTCAAFGQLLQWDYRVIEPLHGGLRLGPLGPCEHQDLRRAGALVPLP